MSAAGHADHPDRPVNRSSPVSDAFVARQPIFDREQRLSGYELLYRPTAGPRAGTTDELRMTCATLVNSVLAIGIDRSTGGVPTWVNFPRELLWERDFELLDPRRYTIELSESVTCDEDTIAACKALRAKGFTLALQGVAATEDLDPILRLAQIVKLDVQAGTVGELEPIVARLRPHNVRLVADKVSDVATYERARKLGFAMFQGSYFSAPEVVRRRDVPTASFGVARLMNRVVDGRTNDRDLEAEFRADPALSLKLLRIVNSAAMGGGGVESIQQAIRLVGRSALHRWLSLMLVSSAPGKTGVEQELMLSSIERGRLCEMMAQRSGRAAAASSLFLTGLLSSFDAILGLSMPDLLKSVRVAPEVEAALLREDGPYTPFLELAISYAGGAWERATELGNEMGLLEDLPAWSSEASLWARELVLSVG
jgi:c-di-GMP phosphodiesterase